MSHWRYIPAASTTSKYKMAVVTFKYIRDKEQIKANLRYITNRSGREHEKLTRAIFTNVGQTDKQEFYRQVRYAGRGTVFFKFMISPDPKREDSGKDLDLPHITRRTIRKLEASHRQAALFCGRSPQRRPHTDPACPRHLSYEGQAL
jgi:hypothetical protein